MYELRLAWGLSPAELFALIWLSLKNPFLGF